MHEINAIFKAVTFAETHLCDEMTIQDMADAAHYSLYHFCRLFNKMTRHTPYDYLIRRRLSASAQALKNSDRKIIEIAFEHQFNSAETFIRAFKRMFGVPPSQYRYADKSLPGMPAFTLPYLAHINHGHFHPPVPLCIKPVTLQGVMTRVEDQLSSPVPKLLNDLARYVDLAIQPVYGIRTLNMQGKTEYYFLGIKGSALPTLGPLVQKTWSGGNQIVFKHPGDNETLCYSYQYLNHTWRTVHKPVSPVCLEIFHATNLKYIIPMN